MSRTLDVQCESLMNTKGDSEWFRYTFTVCQSVSLCKYFPFCIWVLYLILALSTLNQYRGGFVCFLLIYTPFASNTIIYPKISFIKIGLLSAFLCPSVCLSVITSELSPTFLDQAFNFSKKQIVHWNLSESAESENASLNLQTEKNLLWPCLWIYHIYIYMREQHIATVFGFIAPGYNI